MDANIRQHLFSDGRGLVDVLVIKKNLAKAGEREKILNQIIMLQQNIDADKVEANFFFQLQGRGDDIFLIGIGVFFNDLAEPEISIRKFLLTSKARVVFRSSMRFLWVQKPFVWQWAQIFPENVLL
jgi:hypothetical protein